ncbi:MAG: hypothetical protein JOZ24_07220 [Candidatus Eremiobacteraeota bacterium]|nr:hypothetical protein [Candidatus Eremiobacteraeota bacterium]
MRFYEFADKAPRLDGLTVIEGDESVLAQRALDLILDRLLPPDVRALNCDTFFGPEMEQVGRSLADALGAMPFLADRRVVVVRDCRRMRAAARRELWEAVEAMPAGNSLVLEDLFPPAKRTKPESFGQLAGRKALRIDTTANADVRERFVLETLEALSARAQPRAVAILAQSSADLGAIRNDLEKLALAGRTIGLGDLEREMLGVQDVKAWHYARAVIDGRPADALEIAFDLFASDPRGAAIPLASALATDLLLLWELARPGGGELPARHRWRERELRPIARRVGERRARNGYEAAVRGFEAVVTGRIDEPRAMIELLTADLAARLAPPR